MHTEQDWCKKTAQKYSSSNKNLMTSIHADNGICKLLSHEKTAHDV